MRVLKVLEKERSTLDYRCRLAKHATRIDVGETILVDRGDCLMGPFRVVDSVSQFAVVTADEGFNYYIRQESDEVDVGSLEPIFMPEEYYEPVTGDIFLDGLLRSAYYDSKGLLQIEISTKYRELVNFYKSRFEEHGIAYHQTKGGFIVDDEHVVERIFKQYGPFMPIKYIVGYLSAFIILVRVSFNSNPKVSRYEFRLINQYLEDDVCIPNYFEQSVRNQYQLFSYFGSLEPISVLIDETEAELKIYEEPDSNDNDISFREETFMEMVRLMFYYSGHSPIDASDGIALSVLESRLSDVRKVVGFLAADCTIESSWDYAIRDAEAGPEIGKVEGGVCSYYLGLFNNPWFDFGKEMSSYFEIVMKKM